MAFTDIVVLIPTYNERDNVTALIGAVFTALPDSSILVVDDSSPDGTADTVRELAKTYPRVHLLLRAKKEGLGKAYLAAFKEVLKDPKVEWIVMMDADHSHDPAYLAQFLLTAKDADLVVGSRYVQGGATEGWELWRRLLSTWGNRYCRLVTGIPVHDSTSGFNVIRRSILERADVSRLDLSGYAFQIELKYLLWKSGARCCELPIMFKQRREGESKISSHIIREGIIAPWKIRFRK